MKNDGVVLQEIKFGIFLGFITDGIKTVPGSAFGFLQLSACPLLLS